MRNLLPILLLACAAGCGDDGGSGSPDLSIRPDVPHNYDQIRAAIFPPTGPSSCAFTTSCHNEDNPRAPRVSDAGVMTTSSVGNLRLLKDPYSQLVNVAADNAKAKSEGKLRVKPCDPANSFLYIKLTTPPVTIAGQVACPTEDQAPAGTYGGCMPQTSAPLDPNLLLGIHDWIARGAHLVEPADVTGTTCTPDTTDMSMHD